MSEIQVEVCFTDKLESVRVGGKPMEIPKAVKAKPVEEWFEPAAGRVKWGGLGAEIKEMDFGGEKDAAYSFLFNGPEDKKQEFMACVERFCLGEEAQQETKKKTVQDYLQEAKKNQQAGNAEMAFQQYMIAARDYGHPEAQFEVARCYQNGTGVEKNEENALVWYKKAAEQCDAEAQCALGECYYQARGVEKDDKEARRWYEAAATQGNVTAQYMTGRLYAALSYNVAAVKWYTKAAEQECPEAQYELGVCYEAGDGVGKDEAKAAELYRKAAVQGYAEAQNKLGECYNYGSGVAVDENEAEKWYQKAAENGNETAMLTLADKLFVDGSLDDTDEKMQKAAMWYRRAAEQGNMKGQYEWGDCYYNGWGVDKNEEEAVRWYRKAAEQGYA